MCGSIQENKTKPWCSVCKCALYCLPPPKAAVQVLSWTFVGLATLLGLGANFVTSPIQCPLTASRLPSLVSTPLHWLTWVISPLSEMSIYHVQCIVQCSIFVGAESCISATCFLKYLCQISGSPSQAPHLASISSYHNNPSWKQQKRGPQLAIGSVLFEVLSQCFDSGHWGGEVGLVHKESQASHCLIMVSLLCLLSYHVTSQLCRLPANISPSHQHLFLSMVTLSLTIAW